MRAAARRTDTAMSVVMGRHDRLPVDVEGIADDLGIAVVRANLASGIAGRLIRDRLPDGRSAYRIEVNRADNPRRQRFTVAHELAHYVLHRDLIDGALTDDALYRSETLSDTMERHADALAADILVPFSALDQLIEQGQDDPSELAKVFRVSVSAMKIRLEERELLRFSLRRPYEQQRIPFEVDPPKQSGD